MAYIFGSIWDRFNRNALNDLSKNVDIQGKSIQDLVAKGQLTPTQYADLIKIINGLVSKDELTINDFDLNKGKILQRHLSDEVLQAIAGSSSVNAVPADGSVTLRKTAFAKPKKNLFDKNRAEIGKTISITDGYILDHASYYVSDFIEVTPGENISFTNARNVVWYNSGKSYRSGESAATSMIVPANAHYMKFSGILTLIDTAQVEKGSAPTSYEPYEMKILSKYVEKTDTRLEDLKFVRPEKNLIDINKVDRGQALNVTSGDLNPHVAYYTSDFIEVTPGQPLTYSNITRLAYYKDDYVFISGKNNPETETPPTHAKYIKIGNSLNEINSAQVEEGTERTYYSPYRLVIDKSVLPSQSSGGTSQSSDDYAAKKAVAERNALDYVPNVSDELDIPTYVPESVNRHGDLTHPNVLYFANGWNGYKFWMVMTPYPFADNKYENPSIVASNDNVTWVEPAPNPIAPLESGTTFQSDPEILMNGNTMEMWYRATLNTAGNLDATFYRMTSTDGVNWTPREAMFVNNNRTQGEIVSPAMLYENGKYKMWYTRSSTTGAFIQEYAESSDGKTWDSRVLDINFKFKDYYFWHGDVYKHEDGKIDMVIGCKSDTEPWSMFYTYSYDNINFVDPILLIKPRTTTLHWDKDNMYKPSLEKVGDEMYLYYSTPFKVGLTKGKSILELGVHQKRDTDNMQPVMQFRSEINAYGVNDTFEVFPSNTIIFTKIWSTADMGWPELSGNLITYCIFKEAGDVKQVFQPKGKNVEHVRTARSTGWTDWVLKS